MTKSELIARLASKFRHLVTKDAEAAVNSIHKAIAKALLNRNWVEIRGFGSFSLSHKPPRVARNPKSGEKVYVPEKHVPNFRAGKELREGVNARARDLAKRD